MDKPKNKSTHWRIFPVALFLDVLFIVVADLASFIVRFNGQFPANNFEAYQQIAFFIIILRICSFYVFHLYSKPKYKSNFDILINTLKATTASSIIIVFFLYFLGIEAYPRSIVLFSWILTVISVSSWRAVIKEFVGLYLGKDFFRTHLLIIGTGRNAVEAASYALREATIDYKLLGFVKTTESALVHKQTSPILGSIDQIEDIIKSYPIDEVIIAESGIEKHQMGKLIRVLNENKIAFDSMPELYDTVISNTILYEQPAPFLGQPVFAKPTTWYWGFKRILDIFGSLLLLIILSPFLLCVILLIKITSPGPILYFQKRVGRNGGNFVMYKFRTMYVGAEKTGRAIWAKRSDQRITPLGKLFRPYRIDELPQLINVLKNDMSLIGPRPERRSFVNKLIKRIPFYAERLQAKPGISGWAQVNFGYAASEEETEKKLLYDLFYIQNISFTLDLLIFLKTLKVVLTGSGGR